MQLRGISHKITFRPLSFIYFFGIRLGIVKHVINYLYFNVRYIKFLKVYHMRNERYSSF